MSGPAPSRTARPAPVSPATATPCGQGIGRREAERRAQRLAARIGGARSPLGVYQRNPHLYCFGVDSTTPLSFGKSPEGKVIYMMRSELAMTGQTGSFGEAQLINVDALSGRPNHHCFGNYLPIFCVEE